MNYYLHSFALLLTCASLSPYTYTMGLSSSSALSLVSEEAATETCCSTVHDAAAKAHPECLQTHLQELTETLSSEERTIVLNSAHADHLPPLFLLILQIPTDDAHNQKICACVAMLMQYGANPDICLDSSYDITPRATAIQKKAKSILNILNAPLDRTPTFPNALIVTGRKH